MQRPSTRSEIDCENALVSLCSAARSASLGPTPQYFRTIADLKTRAQAFIVGWGPDYPSASNFLQLLFSCGSISTSPLKNVNYSETCDPRLDRLMRRALTLQVSDPPAAGDAWARVDRAVVKGASWVPLFNPTGIDFLSRRVKNYEHNPQYGLLIDQLWVR